MNEARVAKLGRALCLGGAAMGTLGLLGWTTGSRLLTTVVPGQPEMQPNTAVGLLLAGVAGALRYRDGGRLQRTVSFAAAGVAFVIGALTLLEYLLGRDLRIDQLLLPAHAGPYPGRPSPPTALALVLVTTALFLFDTRPTARARPSEWLALLAAVTAFTAMLGQLFGAGALYRLSPSPVIGVAVPTAAGLLSISVGLLLERPQAGVTRVAVSSTPGGVMLRRLGLAALAAPAALALVIAHLDTLVGRELPLVLGVLTTLLALVSVLLIALTAIPLNRAHEALERARAQSQALIEQASDGVFIADLTGHYTDANRAGCRMLGYTREQVVGKSILDLIPPEDAERLWRSKERMDRGEIDIDEWRLRRADGTFFDAEVSAKILPDGRWQGLVRDISGRKQAEEAVRTSQARYAGLISIANDAIISIDQQQRIEIFNEGAERMFGWKASEVMGRPLEVLIPPAQREEHRQHVETFAAEPSRARAMAEDQRTAVGLRKDGQEFPVQATISKLHQGGSWLFTVVLRDVTEQLRREDEARFLAEVGPALAATLDAEAVLTEVARLAVRGLADLAMVDVIDEEGQVRRLKAACRDGARARISEQLSRIPLDSEHSQLREAIESGRPVLQPHLSAAELAVLAGGAQHLRLLRAASPRSLVAVPLVADGKVLGRLSLLSSNRTRRYGPADLHLAQELAQRASLSLQNARSYRAARLATQARDELMAVVAHDLRSPLSSILLQAKALQGAAAPAADDPQQRGIGLIVRAASRMNHLIQDLLDVTRMEAGSLSLEHARVPAAEIVTDSVEAQRPRASAASLELLLDLAPDLPDLWGDRHRLSQVLENLIGNAVKFTAPGGRITVGARRAPDDVIFWVRDTGAGIAAEHLPRVFDRFWQANATDRSGVGLGLPIVKGLVEAHGGRVWVESEPGSGSTFWFTIPIAATETHWPLEPGLHPS